VIITWKFDNITAVYSRVKIFVVPATVIANWNGCPSLQNWV